MVGFFFLMLVLKATFSLVVVRYKAIKATVIAKINNIIIIGLSVLNACFGHFAASITDFCVSFACDQPVFALLLGNDLCLKPTQAKCHCELFL